MRTSEIIGVKREEASAQVSQWESGASQDAKDLRKYLVPIMEGGGHWRVSSRDSEDKVIEEAWYTTPEAVADDLLRWQDESQKREVEQITLGLVGRERASIDAATITTRVVAVHLHHFQVERRGWTEWLWRPNIMVVYGGSTACIWLVQKPCAAAESKSIAKTVGDAVAPDRSGPVLRIPLPHTLYVSEHRYRNSVHFYTLDGDVRFTPSAMKHQTQRTVAVSVALSRANEVMENTQGRGLTLTEFVEVAERARREETSAAVAKVSSKHVIPDEDLL